MTILNNVSKLKLGGTEITEINNFYNNVSKTSEATILTQKGVEEAIKTNSDTDFLTSHKLNMLFDTLVIEDDKDKTYGIGVKFNNDGTFYYPKDCLTNSYETVFLANKIHNKNSTDEYTNTKQSDTENTIDVNYNINDIYISKNILLIPIFNITEWGQNLNIVYFKIDSTNKPITNSDRRTINVYVNGSYKNCVINSNLECTNLYLSSEFFDGLDIDNTEDKITTLSTSNIEKIYVEKKYLNTTLTDESTLKSRIRSILNAKSDITIELN